MRIAVNAADLDHSLIDGTRIYINNLLKNFGLQDKEDRFLIYHRSDFNPELTFPDFPNYRVIRKTFPFWWTQTRFAWEMILERPDAIFMPMHSLPFFRSKKTKTVVTIHDLAFKFFPEHFTGKDLRRINFFTDHAVRKADKIIAISNSTKNDILKTYRGIKENKIKVIYHGYDKSLYRETISKEEIYRVRTKFKIAEKRYILFIGTIQPRKNIETLLAAFERLRSREKYKDLRLVVAGGTGWLAENTLKKIKQTPGALMTGKFETVDLPGLIKGAEVFVLPSLYEGFGLPVVEAMACGTPVAVSKNSSLPEIVQNAGIVFDPNTSEKISEVLSKILEDDKLRSDLCKRGLDRAKDFSWEKCAKETLEWIKSD